MSFVVWWLKLCMSAAPYEKIKMVILQKLQASEARVTEGNQASERSAFA